MEKILIDTDPGMDDTLAIILAAKSHETELVGITSVAGNYPIEITTKNALKSLELVNLSEISVARGMNKPLTRPLPKDPFSHGKDGMGEIFLPNPTSKISNMHAVDYIIDVVKKNPGEVTIICIAPLTNIAIKINGAIFIKEKFNFFSSLGIFTLSTCFLIIIITGVRIIIKPIAIIIGIIPLVPNIPINKGPIPNPKVIAEL